MLWVMLRFFWPPFIIRITIVLPYMNWDRNALCPCYI